jgi:hypothetical protein
MLEYTINEISIDEALGSIPSTKKKKKNYYRVTVVETVWSWSKESHIVQWNRID